MRPKDKEIVPGNDISRIILINLKRKQGDETLYALSQHMGMQQGTLRRKLENPNGWKEINYINSILDFFHMHYDELFNQQIPPGSEKSINDLFEENLNFLREQVSYNNKLLAEINNIFGKKIIEMAKKNIGEEPDKLTPDHSNYKSINDVMAQLDYKK